MSYVRHPIHLYFGNFSQDGLIIVNISCKPWNTLCAYFLKKCTPVPVVKWTYTIIMQSGWHGFIKSATATSTHKKDEKALNFLLWFSSNVEVWDFLLDWKGMHGWRLSFPVNQTRSAVLPCLKKSGQEEGGRSVYHSFLSGRSRSHIQWAGGRWWWWQTRVDSICYHLAPLQYAAVATHIT